MLRRSGPRMAHGRHGSSRTAKTGLGGPRRAGREGSLLRPPPFTRTPERPRLRSPSPQRVSNRSSPTRLPARSAVVLIRWLTPTLQMAPSIPKVHTSWPNGSRTAGSVSNATNPIGGVRIIVNPNVEIVVRADSSTEARPHRLGRSNESWGYRIARDTLDRISKRAAGRGHSSRPSRRQSPCEADVSRRSWRTRGALARAIGRVAACAGPTGR